MSGRLLVVLALWVPVAMASKEFTIGVSGNFSKVADSTNNQWDLIFPGAKHAVRHYAPQLFRRGIKIKIRKLDYGNTFDGVRSTVDAADKEKMLAVVGYGQSRHALLAAQLCQKKQIPLITHTATANAITADKSHVFRVCHINDTMAAQYASFITQELGIKRMITVCDRQNAYSRPLCAKFAREYLARKGTLVMQVDWSELGQGLKRIHEAVRKEPQTGIYICHHEKQAANVLRELLAQGTKPRAFFGTDGWGNIGRILFQLISKEKRPSHLGYNYTLWSPSLPMPKQYQDSGIQRFLAEHPLDSAALMFDATAIIIEQILAGATSRDELVKALNTTTFDGITGKIKFDDQGNPIKSLIVQRIEDSRYRFERVYP